MQLTSPRLVMQPLTDGDFAELHSLLIKGLTTVFASTDTPNNASIKVLERLGFVMTERRTSNGLDTSFFSLRA